MIPFANLKQERLNASHRQKNKLTLSGFELEIGGGHRIQAAAGLEDAAVLAQVALIRANCYALAAVDLHRGALTSASFFCSGEMHGVDTTNTNPRPGTMCSAELDGRPSCSLGWRSLVAWLEQNTCWGQGWGLGSWARVRG